MKKFKIGVSAVAILMMGGALISTTGQIALASEQISSSITLPSNTEQAVKNYILSSLKTKYGEDFSIIGQLEYQLVGKTLKVASASVAPKNNLRETATVFIRENGTMEDTYHINLFSNQLEKLFTPILPTGDLIEKSSVDFWGYPSSTSWKGSESLEKYIVAEEYDARIAVNLTKGKTDMEYANTILSITNSLLSYNYSMTLTVTIGETTLYSQNLKEIDAGTFSIVDVLSQIQDYKESAEMEDAEQETEISDDEDWTFESEDNDNSDDESWAFESEDNEDENWSFENINW